MGLFQAAVKTYENLKEAGYVGKYEEGKEPLAPVGHIIARADIEITLDADGDYRHSAKIPKEAGKVIIPVTEESAGRTSGEAPHPLCEQLKYLSAYDTSSQMRQRKYLEQLESWKNSAFADPKLEAIYRYVARNTILSDLARDGNIELKDGKPDNEKVLVVWNVLGTSGETEVYRDRYLMQRYTEYCLFRKEKQETGLCMVTGEMTPLASQHIRGVFSKAEKARLISENDTRNFTFRGRFETSFEAMTIGYEASQKAHNALKWITTNYGKIIGNRAFICWSPERDDVPDPETSLLNGIFGTELEQTPSFIDYQQALARKLMSYRSNLRDKTNSHTIMVSFDAATSGRLAVVFYSEMSTEDFLEKLENWDERCAWYAGKGIAAPSLPSLAQYAYGTERERTASGRVEVDGNISKEAVVRLLRSRTGAEPIPYDIERRLTENASALIRYGSKTRRILLSTACAAIRKYHFDRWKEDIGMELDKDREDRSYQFGRLLAVYEKMERDTFSSEDGREPNAIQLQSVYCNRPLHYSAELEKQMERAYIPRLTPGARIFYKNLIGEILEKIYRSPDSTWDKPLGDTYLIGYYLQRKSL